MIIQENQLRPPSLKEMQERRVPLERIRLEWPGTCYSGEECCPSGRGSARSDHTLTVTTLELIEFHKDWQIPYEALLDQDGYDGEIALDWTHLTRCGTCLQWFLPGTDHTTTDALHLAKVREMAKMLTGEDVEL